MKAPHSTSRRRVLGSIGWAGADAVGRLVLLAGATVVLSRLIDAEDFGISAIVLAIAAAAGFLVGTPFEEALVQRRILRAVDLRSAFTFSMLVGVGVVLLSMSGAPFLAASYDTPEMTLLLPVAMVSIIFNGHGDLATALARRRRRFNDIAASNLLSHAVGITVSLAMAFAGAGVWALVAMRLVIVIVRSAVLQYQLGYPLRPQIAWRSLKTLAHYASISVLDRLADNLSYLAFANLVGIFHGLVAVGHLNMALRMVEPIRGAIVATSHNLAFPHFRRVANGSANPAERDAIIRLLAYIITAVFVGLAAVVPVLMPIVAGPGWEDAAEMAVFLSLGAAILLPTRLIFTALSASGRPKYSLYGSLTGLAMITILLVATHNEPEYMIGLSRTMADAVQSMIAIAVPLAALQWQTRSRLRLLVPAWLVAAAMGAGVVVLGRWMAPYGDLVTLLVSVPIGIALQLLLMWGLRRAELLQIVDFLRGRPPVDRSGQRAAAE